MAITMLPYSFKFVWAPFVDHFKIPYLTHWLGRRRSWILLSQLGLMICLMGLSQVDPAKNLEFVALWGFGIAFFSATQDIVTMAYQVERLQSTQYGAGEASGIFGYRLGMLLSGAGALYMAEFISWENIYLIMAGCISIGIVTTLICQEPDVPTSETIYFTRTSGRWFLHIIVNPFFDFMQRRGWILTLLIMFFYKLGDNLIGNMHNLLYFELGFSKIEVANVSKIFGMWTSVFGGFVGGVMILRWGIIKSLFYAALIHGIAMLGYLIILYYGYNVWALYGTVALEDFTSGLRITALFAYQMTCCNFAHSATQMALLTSLVHLGRVICSAPSGLLVESFGWGPFFTLSVLSNIPVLIMVWYLARTLQEPLFYSFQKPSS